MDINITQIKDFNQSHVENIVKLCYFYITTFLYFFILGNMMKKIIFCLVLLFTSQFAFSKEIRIYRGNSTYSSDCVATFYKGKLYKKNSTYSSDCIATFYQSKFYKGESTYSSDCFLNYYQKKLHKKESTYSSDILFTFSQNVKSSPALLVWVVYKYFHILFM